MRHLGHMRQRLDDTHLGFVLGAGVSEQAHVPMWGELIQRLYCHYGTDGPPDSYKKNTQPATLVAQFIFNRFFRQQKQQDHLKGFNKPHIVQIAIKNEWYKHIHEAIYRDVQSLQVVREEHPYLVELARLVYSSAFCLTLNFDDILDRIAQEAHIPGLDRQKPNVIWKPPIADRPNACVIYHVNGFLP
ncbi:hypothetical protein [uncultured Enterovirga sp.]|uniref:hypothetical protein n=1 Tax=uncultured Enterovirga sp. TaxID=2026352 RepID=UPI0035CC2AE0